MPDSLRTTVAQFSSSGGQIQPRPANVRAVQPASDLPGAERGNLYILVEVSGGGHAALYRQMLSAAQTAFYEAAGTLNAALIRAIRSAHSVLARANEGLPEAGWRAGISLVALQGPKLTIAQAGPALVLVGQPKTVEQFPGNLEQWTAPIGGAERPDVKIFDTKVEPGAIVLLAQSTWLDQVSPEALAVASALENVSIVCEYLGQVAGKAELAALVIGIGPDMTYEGAAGQPDKVQAGTTPLREVAAVGAATTAAAAERDHQGDQAKGRGLRFWRHQPTAAPEADSVQGALVEPIVVPRPAPARRPLPAPEPEIEEEEPARRSPWGLILALIILPLLILGVVFGMWYFRAQATEKQFQQSLTGAEAILNEVTTIPNESTARQRLVAARELLDQAKAARVRDTRLKPVEDRYQEQFVRLNRVTPIYGILPLYSFEGEDRNLTRVLVSGDSLYVLDRGRNEVYRFVLSRLKDSVTPVDKPVLRKGDPLKDKIVSDLVDITWAEATSSQHSRLLALDTGNNLFSYDVNWGADAVPLAANAQLGQPSLLQGYGGKFYVLDPKARQIWRYLPGQNGYEDAVEPYFAQEDQSDMTGAQSMAVDGSIWLLFSNGRLPRFLSGKQEAFELQGQPDPMSNPVSVAVAQTGTEFYVADAGNERILEFNKDGEFQRQLIDREGKALEDMRSIYLDEAEGALYILTGNSLYKAPIPEVSAPSTTTGQ